MVEILLATYNGEKYIETQLDSLLAQSESDFRILVRDDGSGDHTVEILRSYAQKYPEKFLLIEDEKKCGNPTANFMELIAHATADYVMFSDQDDYWLPEKVAHTCAAMRQAEQKYLSGGSRICGTPILVFSEYTVADADLKPMEIRDDQLQIAAFHTEFCRLLVQNYVTGCTMMLNRACYEHMTGYDPRIQMHDWWAALYCSAVGEIVHLPEKLMYYRQHGNNVVSALNIKSFSYRWKKFHDARARNNWRLGVEQAQLFEERFGAQLPENSRRVLRNFLEIDRHGKIGRVRRLLRGKYLKSDLVRILGQIYFI